MSRARLFHLLLPALLFLLLLAKDPRLLLSPPLRAEDGTEMLAFYYGDRDPGRVLRFYNGYIALVPNLIGYLCAGAPIAWAPTLLSLLPLLIACSSCALPFWLRAPGPTARPAVASVLLAALPLGSTTLVGNTTYSLWNCLLALLLLASAPPAASRAAASARFAASALLLWSHPLSAVALPLYALAAWRAGRTRLRAAAPPTALLALGVAYQLLGVGHDDLDLRPAATLLRLTLRYLTDRVAFEALFGNAGRVALHAAGYGWVAAGVGAAAALLVGALALRGTAPRSAERRLALSLGYGILAVTVGCVIGRSFRTGWLSSPFGERYFYVQKALFWLLLLLAAVPWLAKLGLRRRRLLGAAFVAYALVLVFVERGYYRVPAEEGQRVRDFVARVAAAEARQGGRRGIDETLPRGERGEWTIHLRAP